MGKMKQLLSRKAWWAGLVMALVLVAAISGLAIAEDPPAIEIGPDGLTMPVFDASADGVITEEVWIEAPTDSDNDGKRDLLRLLIKRPKETLEGLKVPVIAESSPYYDYTLWDESNEVFIDIDTDYPGADNPDSQSNTYAGLQYSGYTYQDVLDADFNPAWLPAARVSAQQSVDGTPVGFFTFGWYDYFVPRGYAVVRYHMLGSYRAEGILTDGGYDENLAAAALTDWLNGRVKAYTNPTDNIEVKAYWATGAVAMTGTSYNGSLPLGAAITGVEGLKTIIPIAPVSSYYEYYRANGGNYAPGGYNGEDSQVLTVLCFSRIITGSPVFPTDEVIAEYERVVQQITEDTERETGDYNTFWDERNLLQFGDNINCSIMLMHGYNDLNVKFKQTALIYETCEKYDIPMKSIFHQGAHSSVYNQTGLDFMSNIHKWLDYWLYDIDNGIMDEMPNVVIQNNNDISWEEYESWPLTDQYTRWYFDAERVGALTPQAPETTTQLTYKDDYILSLTRPASHAVQMSSSEYTKWRNYLLGGSAVAAELDPSQPLGDRLLYLADIPNTVKLSGTVKVTAKVAADKNVGAISAMLVDYGEEYRYSTRTDNTGEQITYGGNAGSHNLVRWRRDTSSTPYKIIARGSADVQNPNYNGNIWTDAADTNYVPEYYYQTTAVTPGQFYTYTWELDVMDYEILAGHQLGFILYGSDPEYTNRPLNPTAFTVEIGPETYVDLPMVLLDMTEDKLAFQGLVESYPYVGLAVEPQFNLLYEGVELTAGTDYLVSYSDNSAVGTATVTVSGIGNYSGSVSKTFALGIAEPKAALNAPAIVYIDGDRYLEYTFTVAELAQASSFTFELKVDHGLLDLAADKEPVIYQDDCWVGFFDYDADNGVLELTVQMDGQGLDVTTAEEVPLVGVLFQLKDWVGEAHVDTNLEGKLLSTPEIWLFDENRKTYEADTTVLRDKATTKISKSILQFDLNGNGRFDQGDIDMIIDRYYLYTDADPEWDEAYLYDLDNSGRVDAGDLLLFYAMLRNQG